MGSNLLRIVVAFLGLLMSVEEFEEENRPIMSYKELNEGIEQEASSQSVFDSNPFLPFKSKMEALTMMFFKSGQDNFSERIITKIMYFVKEMVIASHESQSANVDKKKILKEFPPIDRILHFDGREMSKVPKFDIAKHTVVKANGEEQDLLLLKPSHHLKLLMANPVKTKMLTKLPDRTDGARVDLNQGCKWNYDPEFRHPMLLGGKSGRPDLFLGDVVTVEDRAGNLVDVAICNFSTKTINCQQQVFIECYPFVGRCANGPLLGGSVFEVNVSEIKGVVKYQKQDLQTWKSASGGALNKEQQHSIDMVAKYYKDGSNGTLVKVQMIPIILFTENTSGNSTKKCNHCDSYLMTIAAMPLKERNKFENNLFITTHNHLSAMEIIPPLAEDVRMLEQDRVMMYDVDLKKEYVLVFAKVFFMSGDNVQQAELAMNKGSMSTFPCRRCYFQVDGKPNESAEDTEGTAAAAATATAPASPMCWEDHIAPHRTREELALFVDGGQHLPDGHSVRVPNRNRPYNGPLTRFDKLGYKPTGAGALLSLKSLDIVQDTPVEIIHTLLLGVAKYCSITAFKHFFNDKQMLAITKLCREYKSKAFSRNIYSSMKYHKSFLGRDYKILCQVLPMVLHQAYLSSPEFAPFRDEGSLQHYHFVNICSVFDSLGDLVSLVYVERIETNFAVYKREVRAAAEATLNALSELTHTPVNAADDAMKTNLVNRLKTHLLVHLDEDLERSATAIHTETEKGEQYNKEIRDAIRHTNRHNPNRDIAYILARKTVYRHLAYDGHERIGTGLQAYMQMKEYKS
ncbi:hypothetical protein MBANPS3_010977 [Mucor bainieri]